MESEVALMTKPNCDNDESDESVIDMSLEEDMELDLESQDYKDIVDPYLTLYNGLIGIYSLLKYKYK